MGAPADPAAPRPRDSAALPARPPRVPPRAAPRRPPGCSRSTWREAEGPPKHPDTPRPPRARARPALGAGPAALTSPPGSARAQALAAEAAAAPPWRLR